VLITEGQMYMSRSRNDHTSKQLALGEISVSELRPEDRQEIALVQYESKDVAYTVLHLITRPNDGKPFLGPPDVTRYDPKHYKGRLTGLLPR